MLISFSLTVTMLNVQWVTNRFRELLHRPDSSSAQDMYKRYQDAARAALYFLQEAQQAPTRVVQLKGQFSSLVVLPENQPWWRKLQERLKATRRPVTFSLIAQTLFAVIAWVFTIAAAYDKSLGDQAQALILSSGTLWVWLVPIVSGWVFVGTQSTSDSIKEALTAEKAYQAPLPGAAGTPYTVGAVGQREQTGLRVRSGLTMPLHPNPTFYGGFDEEKEPQLPGWCGGNINGDEKNLGPIFNYARIFTWFQLAETIARAFENTLAKVERNEVPPGPLEQSLQNTFRRSDASGEIGSPAKNPGPADYCSDSSRNGLMSHYRHPSEVKSDQASNQSGSYPRTSTPVLPTEQVRDGETTSDRVAQYCGLDGKDSIKAYPEWGDLDSDWWVKIVAATSMAVFIQWGTTGAAIIISYLTEVQGLGCRSGTYSLYGIFSTAAFILLLSSAFFSHQAMLKYQRVLARDKYKDDPRAIKHHSRGRGHTAICALAIITRVTGKIIVVANTIWVITTSLWEVVGFFDSCWCLGTVLNLGEKAWVVLFKSSTELREQAEPSWAGGIAMSCLVCLIMMIVFWLYSEKETN